MTAHEPSDRFAAAYAAWVVRRRWAVLGFVLVAAAAAFAGVLRIEFDDNYRVFFSEDNPHLQALDALEETYAKEEVILFVLAPEGGDVFTRPVLDAVERLTEAAWQIPYCTRVESVTSFQHTHAMGDDIVVEDLVSGALTLSDAELARVREIALSEPLLVNRVISQRGHVTSVTAMLVLPGERGGERKPPIQYARDLVSALETSDPSIAVYMVGGAVTSYSFTEYTFKDLMTLTPLMYVLIFVLVMVTLRSITATLSVIGVIVLSVGSALGLAGWTGLHFTMPSSAMPTIVLTLAVADSIHIMVSLLEQLREGRDKNSALMESVRVNLKPVFVTSLTTCIGLLSMNFSDVPPLRDFGNMTAMGVGCAFFFSILFLPAFTSLLPVRAPTGPPTAHPHLERLACFVVARRKQLLVGCLGVVLALAWFIPRNEFRNNWVEWFDPRTEFARDLRFATENLSGVTGIEFSIEAGESGGITEPAYLERLDAFAQWLCTQPHVDHVSTIADVLKRLNMNMHGDDREWYRLPESRELAAQYLLLYEMSLPYGQDLNNQINVDKSATRLLVITEDVDSVTMTEMTASFEQWLEDNAPAAMHSQATGMSVMFANIAKTTMRSMVWSIPFALLCVSLALILAFRSVKYGLLSLIPNLAPLAMAFGLWGLMVGRINFGVACIAGLGIGIVVDDTVHFLSKYLRGVREYGMDSENAVRYAFNSVGKALWATSVILVMGFGVLTLSSFSFNANMGLLAAITIVFALGADFFLLPPILMLADRDRKSADKTVSDTD